MSPSQDDHSPRHVIVMGVSGSGKTTLAKGLADRLGWTFLEGDDLHPKVNVEKMSAGIPLEDEDRWPWLAAIGRWIDLRVEDSTSAVITCSALKRSYRDVLADGRPSVWFCHAQADQELIQERLEKRRGHYMPASLLPSQFAALEPLQPDERGVTVSAAGDPDQMIEEAMKNLGLTEGDERP